MPGVSASDLYKNPTPLEDRDPNIEYTIEGKPKLYQVQLSKYVKGKLDLVDKFIFETPLGPDKCSQALNEICKREHGKPAAEVFMQFLLDIAEGKPHPYAPKRTTRPGEQLRAIELAHKLIGGDVQLKQMGPEGQQADAMTALASIAKKIHQQRAQPAEGVVVNE